MGWPTNEQPRRPHFLSQVVSRTNVSFRFRFVYRDGTWTGSSIVTWVNNGRFFRLMVFVATSVVFRFGGSGGGASSVATSWPEERAIFSVGSKLSPDSTSVSVVTWFSELDDGSSLSTWNVCPQIEIHTHNIISRISYLEDTFRMPIRMAFIQPIL